MNAPMCSLFTKIGAVSFDCRADFFFFPTGSAWNAKHKQHNNKYKIRIKLNKIKQLITVTY